jgi:hypothetical protein
MNKLEKYTIGVIYGNLKLALELQFQLLSVTSEEAKAEIESDIKSHEQEADRAYKALMEIED